MNKRILVCDDDEGILDMVSILLSLHDFDVIPELHSVNVMQRVKEEKPDAVLIDLWMPLVSGEELAYALKNNPDTQRIPVIVFSASHDGREVVRGLNVEGYVAKPFDISLLVKTVSGVL